jgi:2-methylaconitate cis-trans-isomerase PrpF
MSNLQQIKVPATYMRGGTSKGVFFRLQDLPESCQVAGEARDNLFMRVIGSPDPYAKHIDGMGGATSSTSKCVILSKSSQPNHDVDYLYGQVSIDSAFVDWSGNCGNLSTAAGAFAIHAGLVDAERIPKMACVWCVFGKPISTKPLLPMYPLAMVKYKSWAILN